MQHEWLTNSCSSSLKWPTFFSQTIPTILPNEDTFALRLNWTRSPHSYRTPSLLLMDETLHVSLILWPRLIKYRDMSPFNGKRRRWMILWCAQARSKRGTSSVMLCMSFEIYSGTEITWGGSVFEANKQQSIAILPLPLIMSEQVITVAPQASSTIVLKKGVYTWEMVGIQKSTQSKLRYWLTN